MPTSSQPPEGDRGNPEAALARSEARYRFLAETIPVQIWTARPDGNLDYVTEQTARNFGLSPEQLLRDGWQNVIHPDDLPRAIERWTHALTTGTTYEVEFRVKLADGTYAWYLARAVPQLEDGKPVAWFGTNTNIEEQREQHRRTEALLAEVAAQARDTAAQLHALRAAKEAAEARLALLEARGEKA